MKNTIQKLEAYGVNGSYLQKSNINDQQALDILIGLEKLSANPITSYSDLADRIQEVSDDISFISFSIFGTEFFTQGTPKCEWCTLANSRVMNCKTEEKTMGDYYGSIDLFDGHIRLVIPISSTICVVEIKFSCTLMADIIMIKSIIDGIKKTQCKECKKNLLIIDIDSHNKTRHGNYSNTSSIVERANLT